jgi:hypothetical protein
VPVKSEKQRRFMYASLAGKTDVPPSVAKKFVGPKAHNDGGAVKEPEMMKKPMPPFMMKKKDEKKKPAAKKMMGGGMSYARGGGIESKGNKPAKRVKMMGGGKC